MTDTDNQMNQLQRWEPFAGSLLKARENNCEQASFLFSNEMFSKTLNEETGVTMQNSFRKLHLTHSSKKRHITAITRLNYCAFAR